MSEDGACAVSANSKTTTTTTKKACRFWAPVYDHIYGLFLKRAQAELALRVADAGSDILEIGVGTGLVLPLYPPVSIPDTDRLLSECARVLRPRGKIIIVSKITTSKCAIRWLEQLVSPLLQNVGLSSAFRMDEIREMAEPQSLLSIA